jgi:hypothetical protein
MSVVTAATITSRRVERDIWSMTDLLNWIHRKGVAGAALKSRAEMDLVRMTRSCRLRKPRSSAGRIYAEVATMTPVASRGRQDFGPAEL